MQENLEGVEHVRIFVVRQTIVVNASNLDQMGAQARADSGDRQAFVEVRKQPAYRNMIARSSAGSDVGPVEGAQLVARNPRKLNCEGPNWDISRDAAVHVSVPGYSRDGKQAVVLTTIDDCISYTNSLLILAREGNSWRIERWVELEGWGE